jgi:hypothetical protein
MGWNLIDVVGLGRRFEAYIRFIKYFTDFILFGIDNYSEHPISNPIGVHNVFLRLIIIDGIFVSSLFILYIFCLYTYLLYIFSKINSYQKFGFALGAMVILFDMFLHGNIGWLGNWIIFGGVASLIKNQLTIITSVG